MGHKSDDPFYAFRDEIGNRVASARDRFSKWKVLLEKTNTSNNSELKREMTWLAGDLSRLQVSILLCIFELFWMVFLRDL